MIRLRHLEPKHPSHYWKAVKHRILLPRAWRSRVRAEVQQLTDAAFIERCDWKGSAAEFVAHTHDRVKHRFFFHPRNRKDFFLNLLTGTEPYEHILAAADDVLNNRFATLGSGTVELGKEIPWHKDFKSGKEWPRIAPERIDYIDIENPSDVKVPWELSRFHQVWWLGKAYWLSGREEYAEKFRTLIDDWILNNPPGVGVNWAIAMEAAIRACNWVAGYYFFCESKSCPPEFWLRFFKSLYAHGLFIEHHIEYAWRTGNHYLSNATGMVFLGTFFRHTEFGARWLDWGVRTLEEEMERQVYPDGVDYEKSVSYHRLVLELFYAPTILAQFNKAEFSPAYSKRLEAMFDFMLSYSRPDGSTPNVGDADDGRLFRFIPDEPINDHRHALAVGAAMFRRTDLKLAAGSFKQDVLWMFGGEGFERFQLLRDEPSPMASRAFTEGGFYVMRSERVHIFADCGDLGQRGRGGHGHNDTLSFELWADGAPFIVDAGTYAYTFDREARQKFRSVRAHNTVMVDEWELAPFNGLWEVLEDKTLPRVLRWNSNNDSDLLEGEHRAYTPIVCRRLWELNKRTHSLSITDSVEGSGEHTIGSGFLFHPDVECEHVDRRTIRLKSGSSALRITASAGTWTIVPAWYSPSYGIRVEAKRWQMSERVQLPLTVQLQFALEQS